MKQRTKTVLIFLILISNDTQTITPNFQASCQEITPEIQAKMIYTWCNDAPVPLQDLRYITLSFYDFAGTIHHDGEIIVHKLVAQDVIDIFEKLFEAQYPITSMKLVDSFNGSDDESMSANNCSAFFARLVKNAVPPRWSNHSFGAAIDINPLINPWSKDDKFSPKEGERYLDRTLDEPSMITKASIIYKLFIEKGWQWGGECFFERDGTIDRHHFQKILPGINKNTN